MTVLDLPARPAPAPVVEMPVFLDTSGRRRRQLESVLVLLLVAALLFLGTAGCALV